VDTVPTILDEVIELLNARFAAVIDFAGGTRPEPAGMYGEDERSEGVGVFVIERAIDEDVFRRSRLVRGQRSFVGGSTQGTNGASDLIERNGAALGDGAKYARPCQGAAAQRSGFLLESPARRRLVRLHLHLPTLRSNWLGGNRLSSAVSLPR